jgi:23S rRNA pseudouridine1911/1915/1917 synthase
MDFAATPPPAILYEDNHLLGVVKPAGLLVQGDRTGDPTLLDVLKSYLKRRYDKPGNVYLGLVHRLDRPVSGVLIVARTSKAAARLSAQFRGGSPVKQYLAVVDGAPPADAGELHAHLAAAADTDGVTRAAAAPFAGSREARLRYRVIDRDGDRALLAVELLTGRRHQIRAQLALAGCPVHGDRKYGARPWLPGRLALHAARLLFAHPVSGEPVVLTAPPPADWPWPRPTPIVEPLHDSDPDGE